MSASSPASLSMPAAFAAACKMAGPLEIHAVHRHTGARQSQTFDLPFVLLGRGQPMGMRLDDPSVSQRHAYLQVIEGVPYCTDLGSRTGVVWDDGSQGRGWVSPGQVLRIGIFDVTLDGPGAGGGELPLGEPLDVEDSHEDLHPPLGLEIQVPGGSRTAHHPLERAITLIGRHPACHLRFLQDAISYFHCAIVNTVDGAWCLDFLSRKGTLLNGRTTRLARLRDGDLIEIGKVQLLVHSGHEGPALVLNGDSRTSPGVDDPSLMIPQKVAESVVGAFAPMREVMGQFQECFVAMAQMFTAMQQEQASLMCEQMRLLQELTRELRDLRGDSPRGGAVPPTPHTAPPLPASANGPVGEAAPRVPSQTVYQAPQAAALADAHNWFLERLSKLAQPQPKRE